MRMPQKVNIDYPKICQQNNILFKINISINRKGYSFMETTIKEEIKGKGYTRFSSDTAGY